MTGALLVQIGDTAKIFHEAFTAGRGSSDLAINDAYASPQHAEFRPDGNGWTITDLGSTNGVWVNGGRVYGPHPLAKGDQVQLGRTTLTVVPT